MPIIETRRASLADTNTVLTMMAEFYSYFGYDFERGIAQRALHHLLTNDSLGFVLLPVVDGTIVGYAAVCFVLSLEQGGLVAILDEVYIRETQRGTGLGSTVIGAVEHASRQAGATAVALEVEFDNPRANALYQRLGYQHLERHVMKKVL